MKTSQHRIFVLALTWLSAGSCQALDLFECVRDLLPITPQADFQAKRKSVERPFMAGSNFLVFPEVSGKTVTGFYIYTGKRAFYYDSIQAQGLSSQSLAALQRGGGGDFSYGLVAQPLGLETITLTFTPALGRSQFAGRQPTSVSGLARESRLGHLTVQKSKGEDELWRPLRDEMNVRRQWVQSHNMSEAPFRIFARIVETSCKP